MNGIRVIDISPFVGPDASLDVGVVNDVMASLSELGFM